MNNTAHNVKKEQGFSAIEALLTVTIIMVMLLAPLMMMQHIRAAAGLISLDSLEKEVTAVTDQIKTSLIKNPTAKIITLNEKELTVGNEISQITTTLEGSEADSLKIYVGGNWEGYWVLATSSNNILMPEGQWLTESDLTKVTDSTLPLIVSEHEEEYSPGYVFYNSVTGETISEKVDE